MALRGIPRRPPRKVRGKPNRKPGESRRHYKVVNGQKFCKLCSTTKDVKHFAPYEVAAYDRMYYRSYCRECEPKHRRHRSLASKYGLSLEDYESLVQDQNGRCYLCGESPAKLYVDHDHATGKVRKLLCRECNTGLGMFRDNPAVLRLAADYLEMGWAGAQEIPDFNRSFEK